MHVLLPLRYACVSTGFHVARVAQIAQAMLEHLGELVVAQGELPKNITKRPNRWKKRGADGAGSGDDVSLQRDDLKNLTLQAIMSRIHYFRVHSYAEQLAVLRSLPGFLNAHNEQVVSGAAYGACTSAPGLASRQPVRLVVVDSVAFHFRHDMDNAALRTRRLLSFAQMLNSAASRNNFAAVVVNQVTTKVGKGLRCHPLIIQSCCGSTTVDGAGSYFDETGVASASGAPGGCHARIVPALGEAWSHACTHRIFLFWGDMCENAGSQLQRFAWLEKSPNRPPVTVPFIVCHLGIRDHTPRSSRDRHTIVQAQQCPVKRQRRDDDASRVHTFRVSNNGWNSDVSKTLDA